MARLIDQDAGAVDGRQLVDVLYRRAIAANAGGALVAYVYLSFVAPPQPPPPETGSLHELFHAFGIAPIYFVTAVVVGRVIAGRALRPVERWLAEDRAPIQTERALVLSLPWRAAGLAGIGWLVAGVLFGAQAATHHPAVYVAGVVLGIVLAGLTTTGITFLLVERALRPLFARALAGETPSATSRSLRTGPRLLVSWALGSGVVLVAIAAAFLGRGDSRGDELIGPVLFLSVSGLFGGAVLIAVAAQSIADPVERVTAAVQRVKDGSLDEEVVVDDGGEIGFLEAGFNRMVAGLRERERIRNAFGIYVDREVAEHILSEETDLAGEEVDVTAMFVDIRNFTGIADRAPGPEVVVATINCLFDRAVPIVHRYGGHVDKFTGDGLLAVFGAPRRDNNHANHAFAAALEIERAVADEFGNELLIGIGLNSGSVIAGNVGGGGRFEFSVIGDTVNVAARVEAATRKTGDTVLVSDRTRALLSDRATAGLVERPAVPVKGKSENVALFAPRATARTGPSATAP